MKALNQILKIKFKKKYQKYYKKNYKKYKEKNQYFRCSNKKT